MNNSRASGQVVCVAAPIDPPYSMVCFTDLNNGTCDYPGIDIDIVKILLEEILKLKIMYIKTQSYDQSYELLRRYKYRIFNNSGPQQ